MATDLVARVINLVARATNLAERGRDLVARERDREGWKAISLEATENSRRVVPGDRLEERGWCLAKAEEAPLGGRRGVERRYRELSWPRWSPCTCVAEGAKGRKEPSDRSVENDHRGEKGVRGPRDAQRRKDANRRNIAPKRRLEMAPKEENARASYQQNGVCWSQSESERTGWRKRVGVGIQKNPSDLGGRVS